MLKKKNKRPVYEAILIFEMNLIVQPNVFIFNIYTAKIIIIFSKYFLLFLF